MFTELKKQSLPLTVGSDYLHLRYDNSALLKLERAGVDVFKITINPETTGALLLAGLEDCFNELETPRTEQVERVIDIIKNTDEKQLAEAIYTALRLALPEAPTTAPPKDTPPTPDLKPIYSRFCDVMGKSDDEFWSLTLREVFERWDAFSEFNGWKPTAREVLEFDDD